MENNNGSFLMNVVIMFILFLSLIHLLFNSSGMFFRIQFFAVLLLLMIAVVLIVFVHKAKRGVWAAMLFFYGAIILDIIFFYIYFKNISEIILSLMAAGIGLLIAVIKENEKN